MRTVKMWIHRQPMGEILRAVTSDSALWRINALLGLVVFFLLGFFVLSMSAPVVPASWDQRVIPELSRATDFFLFQGQASDERQSLPQADLDAQLFGVVESSTGSYASIAVNGQPEQLYQEGDALTEYVQVKRIADAEVFVSERGVTKRLVMKSPLRNLHDTLIQVDTAVSTLPAHPAVTGSVVHEHGHYGFKLVAISDPELSQVFSVGDTIVSVNGASLVQLQSDALLWKQLSQKITLTVSVVRNAQKIDLNIPARQAHLFLADANLVD